MVTEGMPAKASARTTSARQSGRRPPFLRGGLDERGLQIRAPQKGDAFLLGVRLFARHGRRSLGKRLPNVRQIVPHLERDVPPIMDSN